ncbi:hypothetical protein [Flavihumibacter sp. CACIAM 22H1]|uniref:hypothetical protein n=1 Tax=Flavihumibacter sp. CACIAM 22H1 TaxID=1812911 RepID=UPI0007A8D2FC|nr:hypothetical protein [Flavihumibacter sp. CACIAM 22H1]KYP15217.1 MAG: hypothetical protein A1D16_03135 [Flavihumibacter sp. CACIAM 22H1]
MKKYFVGIFSLVLAICFNLLQSNTPIERNSGPADQSTFDWYQVSDNEISDIDPLHFGKTKTQAIADDPCKDETSVICLYGTNEEVEVGQNVAGAPNDQLIMKQ